MIEAGIAQAVPAHWVTKDRDDFWQEQEALFFS